MMKFGRFIVYLLYRYYDKDSTKSIAYESAILISVVVLLINFLTIMGLLGLRDKIKLLGGDDSRIIEYIKVAVYTTLAYFGLSLLFKKKNIKGLQYDGEEIKRGYFFVVAYGLFSFVMMIVSTYLK